jgi:hypothetical protein
MGGAAIPGYLIEAAARVASGEAIIDIGSWMGSTTGLLMCGMLQSGNDVELHCYDQWIASEAWRLKAKNAYGIDMEQDSSFLPLFQKYIEPFGIKPVIHQSNFVKASYNGPRKIGLVIDDICSKKPMNDHMMDILLPFCHPGTIFFLMDFYFYEHRRPKRRKYQADFMEMNKATFEFVSRPKPIRTLESKKNYTYTAIYKYKGRNGKIIKPTGKSYWKDWPGDL